MVHSTALARAPHSPYPACTLHARTCPVCVLTAVSGGPAPATVCAPDIPGVLNPPGVPSGLWLHLARRTCTCLQSCASASVQALRCGPCPSSPEGFPLCSDSGDCSPSDPPLLCPPTSQPPCGYGRGQRQQGGSAPPHLRAASTPEGLPPILCPPYPT